MRILPLLHRHNRLHSPCEITPLIQKKAMAWLVLLLLLISSSSLQAQIHEPEGLNLPGTWNSWTNPPTNNLALASSKQVTGGRVTKISVGTVRWQTTIKVAASGGDLTGGNYTWLFTSGDADAPWSNKWAGVQNVQMNTLQNYTYNAGADNTITLTNGKWYTMNWQDQGYESTKAVFMETSAEPVSIQSVNQLPLVVSSDDAVSVTITTSAAPCAEEKIYVRYSNDNWVTSAVALAAFTGSTGTATIPAQAAGVTVAYYVMSTTIGNPTADHDMLTLRFNNNGGPNYFYTVTAPVCGVHVVSTAPSFPKESEALTLTFNANAGNGALQNYAGDVYIHTGVITNLSSSDADWKYTKTEWGENTPETKLTRISDNLYSLSIPDIRAYYGVPSGETILKMVMVFRSDGTTPVAPEYLTHKTAEGSDILVQVYENNLQVKLLNPTGNINVVNAELEMAACAAAMNHTQLSLFVDETQVSTSADETISQLVDLSSYSTGLHWVIAIAENAGIKVYDSIPFYIRGAVPVAALPEGVQAGINYIDNNTVTLVLHDPPALKTYAFAIGDFNGWKLTDEGYMNRTPDGKYYWVTLSGLNAGEEYAYQYLIDGELRLADPYCEKVLDPWNDAYISSAIYPNLKPYPAGQATGIVSVFEPGQTPYNWQVTGFTPPVVQDLVSYELHIRDFVESGSINGVGEKLDYLQSLGVNAIELMPINEFEGNDSWGYNPSFYFAADKAYGTRDDYKRFIDECHKRGMAVIMDMVLNHSFSQSPLVQMYFDASAGEYGQVSAVNPWYNVSSPNTSWSWGYDFNHESVETKNFIDRVNAYWLNEFNVDGFRFDFTKGFTNTAGDGWAYDASRIAILKRMASQIWAAKPGSFVILEHLTDNSEEKELADYGLLLWGNMSHQYSQASMGYSAESDLTWGTHTARGFLYHNLVSYMESHDEERMMYRNLTYGNSAIPAHDVKNLDIALSRSGLAAAFYLVTPGPKMIWQFGELGYDFSINHCPDGSMSSDCRTSRKPIPWSETLDYYHVPERKALYDRYAELLRLKTNFPVFKTSNFNYSLDTYLKRMHLTTDDMKVTLLGNFDVVAQYITPYFQNTGTWYEYFTGEVRTVSGTTDQILLQPGEYRLYSSIPFYSNYYAAASGDLSDVNNWTSNSDGSGNHPSSFTTANTNYYLVNQSNPTIEGNWTLTGANSRLIIGNGVDAVNCTIGAAVVANYIIINANSELTINAGASLTVNERLVNEAGADHLVIASDATGTGSLIQPSRGVHATVQRYLTGGWGDWNTGWHQLSSPVAAQPVADFATGNYDLYGWDEPSNSWMNYKDAGFSVWNGGSDFNTGQGYLVSYEAAGTTQTFTGELNTDDVPQTNLSTNGAAFGGWHLLGNPFASALKWNDGHWALTNVAGTAKIWHEANKSYSDIVADDIIPSAQGFMVQVGSATNSLLIPAASREHDATSFYKSGNAHLLLVAAETEGGSAQESKIVVNPLAANGFDFEYDSRFLAGFAPLFYSVAGDEKLSTNSLPSIQSGMVIPMGFAKNGASAFSIQLKESMDGRMVYLTDTKTGMVTNLTETPEYNFTASEGDEVNRFLLSFGALGINNPEAADDVQVYAYGDRLLIELSSNEPAVVRVYNLTGQLVMEAQTAGHALTALPAKGLSQGIYVVNVVAGNGAVSRKVAIRP